MDIQLAGMDGLEMSRVLERIERARGRHHHRPDGVR
jgi:CheY-like chemotaxis protein